MSDDDIFGESVNRPAYKPIHKDLDAIAERTLVRFPLEEYERLEAKLSIGGPDRAEHGSLNRALDEAEQDWFVANRLWLTARVEREAWERENASLFGSMRHDATAALQSEKDRGKRSKQITDADVEACMATMFGDEWRAQEARRARYKAMEDSLKNLADVWASRCRSLQTMLGKSR